VFDRNVFLLRQKIGISEKYDVTDEGGNKLLYVVRPAHALRQLASIAAVVGIFCLGAWLLWLLARAYPEAEWFWGVALGALVGCSVLSGAAVVALTRRRNVFFYRDAERSEKLLEIVQDRRFAFIARYTVLDAMGAIVGRFEKNPLYDLLRKRWNVY